MQSAIALEMPLLSLVGKSKYFVIYMFKISLYFEGPVSQRGLPTHLLLLKFA